MSRTRYSWVMMSCCPVADLRTNGGRYFAAHRSMKGNLKDVVLRKAETTENGVMWIPRPAARSCGATSAGKSRIVPNAGLDLEPNHERLKRMGVRVGMSRLCARINRVKTRRGGRCVYFGIFLLLRAVHNLEDVK